MCTIYLFTPFSFLSILSFSTIPFFKNNKKNSYFTFYTDHDSLHLQRLNLRRTDFTRPLNSTLTETKIAMFYMLVLNIICLQICIKLLLYFMGNSTRFRNVVLVSKYVWDENCVQTVKNGGRNKQCNYYYHIISPKYDGILFWYHGIF